VQVAAVSSEQSVTVPVHVPAVYTQPWFWQSVCRLSWTQGVIVPVHVVVCCQLQPDAQVVAELNVEQAAGVPEHVPPTPAAVQVQPSAWHCTWKLDEALVQSAQISGVPVHVPGPTTDVHPWHSVEPHSDVGHCAQVE